MRHLSTTLRVFGYFRVYLIYYLRKGTLKSATINSIGREQEARSLIGREVFMGTIKIHNVYMIANGRAVFCSQPIRRPKTVPTKRLHAHTWPWFIYKLILNIYIITINVFISNMLLA